MPSTEQSTEPKTGLGGLVDRLSSVSDKLDKIWSFAAKVASGVAIVVTPLYTWAGNAVALAPRPWLFAVIAGCALIGIAVWTLTYVRRIWWGRWRIALTAIAGGVSAAIALAVWLLMPAPPAWQRLDIPHMPMQASTPADLPWRVLQDQLSGSRGAIPGGETYKQLLDAARGAAQIQEQWAGYYAPLVVAGTKPSTISLRTGTALTSHASIGAIVVIWSPGPNGIPAVRWVPFGFDSLRESVSLPVSIGADERAAIFVLVYPLTSEASAHLPDNVDEAISVQ